MMKSEGVKILPKDAVCSCVCVHSREADLRLEIWLHGSARASPGLTSTRLLYAAAKTQVPVCSALNEVDVSHGIQSFKDGTRLVLHLALRMFGMSQQIQEK